MSATPVKSTPWGDRRLGAFVSSLQLADSFFPSGLYTLSYGLEALAQAGLLDDERLEPLLADYLRYGVGTADGTALACAHRASRAGDVEIAAEADARLSAIKLPREARETSERVGRQLLATAAAVFGGELLALYAERARTRSVPGNHAIALGLITSQLGIRRAHAVAGELYSFASTAVAAAVRLAVVDHVRAQRVLDGLRPVIVEVARSRASGEVHDIVSSLPLIDMMCMRHEEAELRMFMS